MKTIGSTLHESIAQICPIVTIRSNDSDKSTWEIVFDNAATDGQRQAAQQLMDNFDLEAFKAQPEPISLENKVTQLTAALLAKGSITVEQLSSSSIEEIKVK